VDEYQDTNRIQGDLIDLLAEGHGNVMVVGDDAQSIYAWRGADFHNILQFPKRYPGAKVYRIEVNYRSTPEILQVANAAISANQFQFQKELAPARKSGMKPVVVACRNASEQAAFVAQRALELRDEGIELDHMAVLYRSHFHALELQLELTRQNIPFSITSGIRFFEQAHIKDVAAHIKFVVNPRDELSFKRIVQLLPGVGGKGAAKLWERFEREAASARASGDSAFLGAAIQRCESAAGKKTRTAWAQFSATIAQLERALEKESAADLIALVLQAGYEDYLKESYANHGSRMDDLEQLAIFARQFNTIEDCLTQLALLTNLEAEGDRPADDDERLRLSTVHQAKGLEFEVVFVIMLCDGLFPSARSLDHDESVEEERRLMYVAITRAKTELYLCYPEARASYNDDGETPQRISRFLREIPRELMEDWNLTRPF
jgi:DNA helicase-2/ATP-dependent DNA helicase PcrA